MPYFNLPRHSADGNLLFGVLALQADLITSRQFIEACSAWAARKDTTMADLLVQDGLLSAAQLAEVEGHLERKLARHGGSVRSILAHVMSNSLQRTLAAVKDHEFRPLLDSLTQDVGFTVAPTGYHLQRAGPKTSLDDRPQPSWDAELPLTQRESRRLQARRWFMKHRTLVNSAAVTLVAAAVVLALALPSAQPENQRADQRDHPDAVQPRRGPGPWGAWGGMAGQPTAVQGQTLALVRALFGTLVRKEDVLEHLRRDPALSESLRQHALALAKDYPQYPNDLNNASWFVVRQPSVNAAAYHHALLQAQEACRLAPGNGYYLNTLGVAQYRVALYQEALETLTQSNQINSAPNQINIALPAGSHPDDLAFLAMAYQQLGQEDQAQATLVRLKEVMKKSAWSSDAECKAFLREAEDLILGEQGNPQK